eukprot:gnl/TRDRNA2_/TRDRNA2_104586_c0_seq1.p1 gnl/TRDRNA2_/TRDRNA2_104586_c0~~gnl/TRDRNA2_/TRDRNA2_104586_c0_seq1.p1  ORF type:complete len:449 (+),score=60.90 gnl/TRDRNA2_/TRDRNA2_104586_c0_seq1:68-1348(+)
MSQGLVPWCRGHLSNMISSGRFDYAMAVVIIANSVCMAVESSWSLSGWDTTVLRNIENGFLAVFIIELGTILFVKGRVVLKDFWFVFDAILVVCGVVSFFIIEPLADVSDGPEQLTQNLESMLILRLMRLLRLLRALRLLPMFDTLWRLTNGLLSSAGTIFSVVMLLLLSLWIFANFAIEIITKGIKYCGGDAECEEITNRHFSGLIESMITLVQFVTMDSISAIYVPLIKQRPSLILYFGFLMAVVSITLMNLVTAVLVEHAMETAHQDTELQKLQQRNKMRKLSPQLIELFELIDANGDGMITTDEIARYISDGKIMTFSEELAAILTPDTMMDIFDILDVDRSGNIDKVEFVEGILCMQLSDVPIETTHMIKMLRLLRKMIVDLWEQRTVSEGAIEKLTSMHIGVHASLNEFLQRTNVDQMKC